MQKENANTIEKCLKDLFLLIIKERNISQHDDRIRTNIASNLDFKKTIENFTKSEPASSESKLIIIFNSVCTRFQDPKVPIEIWNIRIK